VLRLLIVPGAPSFSRPDLLAIVRRWILEFARYGFREELMGRI
jgi:hypothetical protein